MVTLRETCRACGLVAAHRGSENPPGLGAVLPDELMDKVAKLNVANVFSRTMALAGDIRGKLIVTLPSLKELKNHEVSKHVEEFCSSGSEEPIENMLKVHKLLQNWTAGLQQGGHLARLQANYGTENYARTGHLYDHEKELVKWVLCLRGK